MSTMNVLLVDDEVIIRDSLSILLSKMNCHVVTAKNGREAFDIFEQNQFDLILTDFKMPEMDGLQLLKNIREQDDNAIVVIMTAYGSIENAVMAMRDGAFDYLTKPCSAGLMEVTLDKVRRYKDIRDQNIHYLDQLTEQYGFGNIIGKSERMKEIYGLIQTVANTNSTVLITGESGTGKELIANAIHYNSYRRDKAFVKLHCAALSEGVLESELFGHEKGSFTGAIKDRKGRFEAADQGTLFLDEVASIPMATQVKLLRVLQEGELERVGGSETKQVDVRLIGATHRNLEEMVKNETFREDLYYRLNVIEIELPSLRERIEDVSLLVDHFLDQYCDINNKERKTFSNAALSLLMDFEWPGNVRQLENVVERAVVLSREERIITTDYLPNELKKIQSKDEIFREDTTLKGMVDRFEMEIILKVLNEKGWNRSEAARVMGLNRTTLYEKMRKYGITVPEQYN